MIRTLNDADVELVRGIDRSEHVDVQYAVVDGALVERPVVRADVPPWDPVGDGDFTVAHHVEFVAARLAEGGVLLGSFDDATGEVQGLAVVHPRFEPPLAWLSWLHVTRAHRRRGVAAALWRVAAALSRDSGATELYVSATPTGSAVGFYLSRGCRLATPPHPRHYADEPDDIHLVCPLG